MGFSSRINPWSRMISTRFFYLRYVWQVNTEDETPDFVTKLLHFYSPDVGGVNPTDSCGRLPIRPIVPKMAIKAIYSTSER
jgi:hypothetical protein